MPMSKERQDGEALQREAQSISLKHLAQSRATSARPAAPEGKRPRGRPSNWARNFEQLKIKMAAKYPTGGYVTTKGLQTGLATWVETQRNEYHRKRLPKDKIEMLQGIGFLWEEDPSPGNQKSPQGKKASSKKSPNQGAKIQSPSTPSNKNDDKWESQFNRLVNHMRIHYPDGGYVSTSQCDDQLKSWIKRQRTLYKQRDAGVVTPLTNHRIEKLESIKFHWVNSNNTASSKPRTQVAQAEPIADEAARKSSSLPAETVEYLKAWMMSPEHIAHPYPTEPEKAKIMADTGIELKQLTNWFVNNRKRYWKPNSHSLRPTVLDVVEPATSEEEDVFPATSEEEDNKTEAEDSEDETRAIEVQGQDSLRECTSASDSEEESNRASLPQKTSSPKRNRKSSTSARAEKRKREDSNSEDSDSDKTEDRKPAAKRQRSHHSESVANDNSRLDDLIKDNLPRLLSSQLDHLETLKKENTRLMDEVSTLRAANQELERRNRSLEEKNEDLQESHKNERQRRKLAERQIKKFKK